MNMVLPAIQALAESGWLVKKTLCVVETERKENLVLPPLFETLGLSTLTLAPFDKRLIDKAQLTPREKAWIDGFGLCVHRWQREADGKE